MPFSYTMSDVTRILQKIESGDPNAANQLLPLVYDELRKLAAVRIANESPGQTLQATALIHEAYIRLVGVEHTAGWNGRGHFFSAAAEAMRRILIENARQKLSLKRGANQKLHEANEEIPAKSDPLDLAEMITIHELLDLLAVQHPRKAEVVKLRYFLGCTQKESAQILSITEDTAQEDWVFAKAWLKRQWRKEETAANANLSLPI